MLKKIFQKEIGQIIPGLEIHGKPAPYGVLNERAIRATAGTMMLVGFITFFFVFTTKNWNYLFPTVIVFWIQFFISVFFWTEYAPFSMIGRFLVSKQKPDYVWAVQKRFAWAIGLTMASLMLVVTVGLGMKWTVPMIICFTCLSFMWLESAVGICVWCKIYGFLLKKWIIPEPEHRPACPGGACLIDFGKKK